MRFTVAAWAATRVLIALAFIAATPHALAAAGNWDGAWYASIALHGYGYAHIGSQRDVAFFPGFPLIVGESIGRIAPWPLCAAIANNLAFLAALLVTYRISARRWDSATARWIVAFACACPMSLFCSVAYPEALYLCLTAFALLALERRRSLAAALLGALASAVSAVGVTFAAVLTLESLSRRDWREAAIRSLSFLGIAVFAVYCYLKFGDALAFVHAQRAWRHGPGFDAAAWWSVAKTLTSLDGLRLNLMAIVLVPVGAVVVLAQRKALGTVPAAYALLAIALLLFSGEPVSVGRKAFTVVPVLFAYGRLWRRLPVAGCLAVGLCLVLLVLESRAFAAFHWAG